MVNENDGEKYESASIIEKLSLEKRDPPNSVVKVDSPAVHDGIANN